MELLDEEGRVLGLVNVVDALVVLLVLAVVLAGGTLLLDSPDGGAATTQEVTFRTEPQPEYVVDVIAEGPVPTDGVVAVEERSIHNRTENGTAVDLRVRLEVTTDSNGLSEFRGERLYVGRQLRLDLGTTVVEGVVVDMGPRTNASER